MKTPYDILGISADADDDAIKQAYLQQIKSHPPDRAPHRFQAIQQAYQAIKDHKSRLNHALFTQPPTDIEPLLDIALKAPASIHMTPAQFTKLLDAGLDDENLLEVISEHKQA